jgi:hypothetical protein
MNELVEKITKLTDEWYSLIGKDHHKDRDCHWYIESKWSYGNSPVYLVVHYGYIIDEINEPCATYEDALKTLKNILEKEIREYRSYLTQDDES